MKHQEGTPQERGMHMKFLMFFWNILLIAWCSIISHDLCYVISPLWSIAVEMVSNMHSEYTFTHSLVLCFIAPCKMLWCYNELLTDRWIQHFMSARPKRFHPLQAVSMLGLKHHISGATTSLTEYIEFIQARFIAHWLVLIRIFFKEITFRESSNQPVDTML